MLEEDEAQAALDLLDSALSLDPDYPFALALAAWCHAQRYVYNWTDDHKTALDTALILARRAEAQGDDDPMTLAVLGTVLTLAKQLDRARGFLERAVSIDPNGAWAWGRLGWLEAISGNADRAEDCLRRSLDLSPFDPLTFNTYGGLGAARMQIGDFQGAVPHFERALRERPRAIWLWRALTLCLMGAEEETRAREAANHLMQIQPNFSIRRYLDAIAGRPEMKERFAELLRRAGLPEN